jgi:chorismate mutase
VASAEYHAALEKLRQQINQLDDELLQVLSTRMKVAEKIGEYTTQTSILELMLHLFIILKNDKLISKAASQLELAQKHRKLYSS